MKKLWHKHRARPSRWEAKHMHWHSYRHPQASNWLTANTAWMNSVTPLSCSITPPSHSLVLSSSTSAELEWTYLCTRLHLISASSIHTILGMALWMQAHTQRLDLYRLVLPRRRVGAWLQTMTLLFWKCTRQSYLWRRQTRHVKPSKSVPGICQLYIDIFSNSSQRMTWGHIFRRQLELCTANS